jgi:hypothetical protein
MFRYWNPFQGSHWKFLDTFVFTELILELLWRVTFVSAASANMVRVHDLL